MTLPLRDPAPSGEAVVVATAESPGGPWAYLPAALGPGRRSVTFTVTHHSLFTAIGFAVAALVRVFRRDFLNGLDSGATTTVARPACSGQRYAYQGYEVISSAGPAVYWCLGMNGTGRILKIVDHRRYPMDVSHPEMPVVERPSVDPFQLSSLSHLVSGPDTILAAGQEIGYGVAVPAGEVRVVQTQIDGPGQSLYVLQVALTTLSEILTRFGISDGRGIAALMNAAVTDNTCADALMSRNPGAFISGCLTPAQVVTIFHAAGAGSVGWLLAPIVASGGVIAFLASSLQEAHDILTSQSRYTITVAACPDSAQLLATWNATPLGVRDSWAAAGVQVSGFTSITCWGGWVAGVPVTNGNGWFVFSQQGGLHLLPATQLPQFDKAVCGAPGSPWRGGSPAGPANCGS